MNEVIEHEVDKSKLKQTIVPELLKIIQYLDKKYEDLFVVDPREVTLSLDAAVALKMGKTEVKALTSCLDYGNREWTVTELKRLLRIAINDFYQRIMETPGMLLQSSFCIDDTNATLQRLSDALTRMITAF
jgi:hypothetical protein